MIGAICGWAVAALAAQLWRHVRLRTAVDRTIGTVPIRDAPALFTLHFAGLVAAMVAAAGLGTGALAVAAARIVYLIAG